MHRSTRALIGGSNHVAEGNLGPKERRKRLIMGVIALALGVGVALAARPKPVAWRFVVLAFFWVAGLGLFQAKEKT